MELQCKRGSPHNIQSTDYLYSINATGLEWKVTQFITQPQNMFSSRYGHSKHTTTFFSLFDHYIISRELRVIFDLAQTNSMVYLW